MKRIAVVLSFLLALSLGVCALADTAEPIGQKTWGVKSSSMGISGTWAAM